MSKLHAESLQDRTFEHNSEHGDFSAYHACMDWLKAVGCSTGSMQRGAPTAVMFADNYDISKHRNLRKHEVDETHGWVTGTGGRFRGGDVFFKVTPAGKAFLAAIKAPA